MPSVPIAAGTLDENRVPSYAPQTARGRKTRQRLLDAAVAEFGEKGFHAASVSAITGRAHIGQGTFYIYFASKDACFHLVVDHASREMRRALLRSLSPLNLDEALRDGIARCLRFTRDCPDSFRVLCEARLTHPEGWQRHVERLVNSFTDLIERHARTLVPHDDRALYAHFVVGAVQHLATQPTDVIGDIDTIAQRLAATLRDCLEPAVG